MALRRSLLVLVVAAVLSAACGGSDDSSAEPLVLTKSPEFVNRLIPGRRPLALVSAAAGEGERSALAGRSSLAGMTVSFEPDTLAPGDTVEVWVSVPAVSEDAPFTVTVEVGEGEETQTLTVDATAVPGADDVAETARDIASVFLGRLTGSVPGLPVDTSGLVGGTPVAGLLVVTHYAWFTEELEIGLAWHIMVAPDDFAELYIRPRDQQVPTHTYRINSWSTALNGGAYTFSEVPALSEVVR
jgi:hypothetical protein